MRRLGFDPTSVVISRQTNLDGGEVPLFGGTQGAVVEPNPKSTQRGRVRPNALPGGTYGKRRIKFDSPTILTDEKNLSVI